MKRIRKFAALLAATAMLVLLPEANAFEANAEEPATYAAKYVEGKGWRFQYDTNAYDDEEEGAEIRYLREYAKDGDVVVVYNYVGATAPLDLSGTHLGNLTIYQNSPYTVVTVGTADYCYVQGGNTCAINGTITNAYVFDESTCTFNNNVTNLTIYSSDSQKPTSTVTCAGTVGHFVATTLKDDPRIYYDLYDFTAGTFNVRKGSVKTAETNYSSQPTGVAPADTASTAPAADTATDNSADEYDDVPKTGQSSLYVWFLSASVLCYAGSRALRRADR